MSRDVVFDENLSKGLPNDQSQADDDGFLLERDRTVDWVSGTHPMDHNPGQTDSNEPRNEEAVQGCEPDAPDPSSLADPRDRALPGLRNRSVLRRLQRFIELNLAEMYEPELRSGHQQ